MQVEADLLKMLFEAFLSIMVGVIVGYERAHERKSIGVKECTALSLLGTLAAWLTSLTGQFLILPGVIIAVGLLTIYLMNAALRRLIILGTTTSFAILTTFASGVLIGYGEYILVSLSLFAMLIILSEKRHVHSFVYRLSDDEIRNGLEFAVLAAVLYPVAPDQYIDPFNLINLKKVLLIVVLVSAISFINLIVGRFLGSNRGLEITGLLGGLVHSEATTVTIALRASKSLALLKPALAGILLSNASMLLRNLVVAGLIMPLVMVNMLPAILAMELVLLLFAYQAIRSCKETEEVEKMDLRLSSPFAIKPAIQFGLVFLVLMVLAGLANRFFGDQGVYVIALFGGISFAGAIVASVSTLALIGSLNVEAAALAIIIACFVAQLNKFLWANVARAPKLARALVKPTLITVVAGIIVVAYQTYFLH